MPSPTPRKRMTLQHAILTSLVERPATGAGLARRFDRSIGYFWQATHQQIYRELGRLEEAGWVASEPVETGPGRQRRYRVRSAGQRELRRWIAEDSPPQAVRDALMVRLRAEAALGPSGLEQHVQRALVRDSERLALYTSIEARSFPASASATREQRLQQLVLRSGIRRVALRIELYREALEILAMPSDP